jgi:hypothetical protein
MQKLGYFGLEIHGLLGHKSVWFLTSIKNGKVPKRKVPATRLQRETVSP